ncbi:hypothetical protein [Bacillus nitroreducens]
MVKFVDDLIGAIYDVFKCILKSMVYLLAGGIMVAIPMCFFVWLMGIIQK